MRPTQKIHRQSRGHAKRARLQFEQLEPRTMFDGNGLLLANDAYLTLSFAADETNVANQPNALAAKFNAIAPQNVWEEAILRAFQSWAVNTNADVGVVVDGGQFFGTPGPTHGDSRFGDIRIAAIAMDPQIGAESTPLDRIVGGTWQADVVFNTNFNFQSVNDIYEIALHEAGHVFGLEHSADPNSPMHDGTIPTASVPTAQDLNTLRSLYGARLPDFNEQDRGSPNSDNNSFDRATVLVVDDTPGTIRGSAPVLAYGDITTANDLDFFRLKLPDTYAGPVNVAIRSAGMSLLAPHVRVYNENRQLVQEFISTSKSGDTFTFSLSSASPNEIYYFEVSGAAGDAFGLGGYAVKATFPGVPQVDLRILAGYRDSDLRKLSQDEIRKLIVPSQDHFLNEDLHADDNLNDAIPLSDRTDFTDPSRFETIGSISDAVDRDFYRVRSPANISVPNNVLTVVLRTLSAGRLVPAVHVFDHNQHELAATVLANGGGELVLQVAGIESNRNYYVEVAAANPAGPFNVGNYQVTASFRDQAANLQTFAAGTLSDGATRNEHSLYVAQPHLFHFLLQAGTQQVNMPASAVATISDANGITVYQIATNVGNAQSQGAVLLAPGTYTMRLSSLSFQGPLASSIAYSLTGIAISDPFASELIDETTSPFINTDPTLGGAYVYPGGVYSNDPYLWSSFISSLPGVPATDPATQVSLVIGSWWTWYWNQAGTNGPPLSQADSYSLPLNATLNVSVDAGVLSNDNDPEGDPSVAVLLSGPSSGTLDLHPDGSFNFTPDVDFNGVVQFTYQAYDFRQLSTPSTVAISVGPIGDYDHNGVVEQPDYDTWRSNFATTSQLPGDGNANGLVDAADYILWRKHVTLLPAPAASGSSLVPEAVATVAMPVAKPMAHSEPMAADLTSTTPLWIEPPFNPTFVVASPDNRIERATQVAPAASPSVTLLSLLAFAATPQESEVLAVDAAFGEVSGSANSPVEIDGLLLVGLTKPLPRTF